MADGPGFRIRSTRATDLCSEADHAMTALPLYAQLINLLAAILLLLAFAMLAQRRVLSLINLFALQGFALAISTGIVAFATHQPHLYYSAGLTLALKVLLLPWLLHRLIRQLDVKWDVE